MLDKAGMASSVSISIIMPVRNGMPFIRDAVDSFLRQDWPHKQLIVVDGLSSDGTSAFLDGLPSAQVSVVRSSDRSATEALNKGVRVIDGDVIGLLMSDDWLAPGALRAVAEAFQADAGLDLLAGVVDLTDGRGGLSTIIGVEAFPLSLERLLGTPYAAAFFVRASTWRQMGGFDERFRFGADRDFLMRARLSGATARAMDTEVYTYRQHPGSATLGNNEEVIVAFLNDHLFMVENWLKSTRAAADRDALIRWRRHEAVALTRLHVKRREFGAIARMLIRHSLRDAGLLIDVASTLAASARNWLRPRPQAC